MAEPTIDLSDFDGLTSFLERIPDMALDAARDAMEEATLWLQGEISALASAYPEFPERGFLKTMSPKAQHWFWWAVRKGKVSGWKWVEDEDGGHPEGHYYRTGRLGASINHQVTAERDEIIGEVGTALNYAPWVIGPAYPGRSFTFGGKSLTMYQARIHEKRWFNFEEEIEARLEQAQVEFKNKFFEVLEKLSRERRY